MLVRETRASIRELPVPETLGTLRSFPGQSDKDEAPRPAWRIRGDLMRAPGDGLGRQVLGFQLVPREPVAAVLERRHEVERPCINNIKVPQVTLRCTGG